MFEDEDRAEVAKKAWAAFQAFLDWTTNEKVTFAKAEVSMVSERFRYGGTIDAIGEIDKAQALFDWKTGGNVYGDHLLQLAGYGILANENTHLFPGGYHLIFLPKDGGDVRPLNFSHEELSEARTMFLTLRGAYERDKAIAKLVRRTRKGM